MHHSVSRFIAAASLAMLACGAQATVLTTVDLTAIDGSWASINAAPVRVNFGGYGTGTISASTYNGGFYQNFISNYGGENYSGLPLSNGNTLDVTNESVFVIGRGASAAANTLAGVTMTFKLDNGSFGTGGLLNIRSMDWTGSGIRQYFSPGEGLTAPLSTQLPSDFGSANGILVPQGADADGNLWGADRQGSVSNGLAFALGDDVGEFSFRLLTSGTYGGGVAFSFALPPVEEVGQVPEPSSLALTGLAFAGLAMVGRRRRAAATRG